MSDTRSAWQSALALRTKHEAVDIHERDFWEQIAEIAQREMEGD